MQIVAVIFFLFLPPYVLAVIMPSWFWLLAYFIAGGGLLSAWFAEMATAPQHYGEEAIGFLFLAPVAVSFGAGTLIRAATLVMAARGRSRSSVFAINGLGFSIPLGILGVAAAWAAWESRPPSEACLKGVFDVELARGRLAVPTAPIVSIFLGSKAGEHEYNFAIPPKLRDFCAAATDAGRSTIRATRIWIRLGLAPDMTEMSEPKFCTTPPAWAAALCPDIALAKRSHSYESALPYSVLLYSSDAVDADSFGGLLSTFGYSLIAATPKGGGFFVRSASRTPDGNPLTFACREGSDHKHWCETSYPWRDGMQLGYQFRTDETNIGEKGERVDAALKGFLEKLRGKNEN